MEYPGLELETFDKAKIWRKYIFFLIKKYFKNEILEVGAGIGSFTKNYINEFNNITLSETDSKNLDYIKKKFATKKIDTSDKLIQNINKKFNTIIYLNVLEHIEGDIDEINNALEKLNSNGYLIVLVPAHNKLYSKFDKAVGHVKRYELDFFKKNKFENTELVDLYYLDCLGYLLYYINRIFFKEETYPSKFKVMVWDKFFTPITILIDFLLRYRFGKNIMCIYRKK
jgi:cob(I)alamin adenosyltransferase